jgi:hypothetical protein
MRGNVRDLSGQRFGKLTVVSFVRVEPGKGAIWSCQCDCGKVVLIKSAGLLFKNNKSCGCLRKLAVGEAGVNRTLDDYKRSALDRCLDFSLSRAEFTHLIQGSCEYCGNKNSKNVKVYGGYFSCNGIDRVDSTIGYVLGNCVPCCKICNWMKSSLSLEDFKNHIAKIYDKFKSAASLLSE